MKLFFLLMGMTICFSNSACDAACNRSDYIAADNEVTNLRTWNELYKSFKKYGNCDDGGLAEGYSEVVATLLTSKWQTFPSLNKITLKDSSFKNFVIRHIDELMTPDQWNEIKTHSAKNCPNGCASLCEEIGIHMKKLEDLLKSGSTTDNKKPN